MSPDIPPPPPPFPFPYQVGGREKGEGEGIGTREAEKNGVGSDSWCSVGYFLNTPRGGRSV